MFVLDDVAHFKVADLAVRSVRLLVTPKQNTFFKSTQKNCCHGLVDRLT